MFIQSLDVFEGSMISEGGHVEQEQNHLVQLIIDAVDVEDHHDLDDD
jgi:hypothetical protein